MTQQGLSSEEIAQIMTGRGMVLKKGSSTIARLQTIWQLRGTEESRLKNRRYLSRRKARRLQLEEFQNYAKELGLENPDEWVKNKMDEPAIQQMRRDAAYELMGDAAPQPKERKAKPAARRTRKSGSQAIDSERSAMADSNITVDNDADSSDDDGDEITADISTLSRTLRSGRASGDAAFADMSRNVDSESSDEDAEFQAMEGVTMDDAGDETINDDRHRYGPLLEQDEDDEEEEESEDEAAAPTPVEPSVAFTNATMAPIPTDEGERENMDRLINSADGCIAAAQLLKDLLQAKSAGQPAPRSLTGLPPSVKDIEAARHRLKEAAHATVGLL
jgi:hypothetical protein